MRRRPFFSPLGEPLTVIGNLKHQAPDASISHFIRDDTRFYRAPPPVLRAVNA
jgi:hypothetical protein